MDRVNAIRTIIPECALSTDMITGFCTETEEDHKESLSLMEWVGFDFAYMFKYSERPGTKAARKYKDDVPESIKSERLSEMIALQNKLSQNQKSMMLEKSLRYLLKDLQKDLKNFFQDAPHRIRLLFFRGGQS